MYTKHCYNIYIFHVSLKKTLTLYPINKPQKNDYKKGLPAKKYVQEGDVYCQTQPGKKLLPPGKKRSPFQLKQSSPLPEKKSMREMFIARQGLEINISLMETKGLPSPLPSQKTSPLQVICLLILSFKNKMLLGFLNLSFIKYL